MSKGGITGFVPAEGSGGYMCEHCQVIIPLDPEAMMNHKCEARLVEAAMHPDVKLPNDSFEDYLPLTPVRFAPGEYKIMTRDGQQLWIMEGASLADFVCQSVNGYSTLLRERRLGVRILPTPLCPPHQSLEDNGHLECAYNGNCVACSLNERAELLDILATGHGPGPIHTTSVEMLREIMEERRWRIACPDCGGHLVKFESAGLYRCSNCQDLKRLRETIDEGPLDQTADYYTMHPERDNRAKRRDYRGREVCGDASHKGYGQAGCLDCAESGTSLTD